MVLHPHSAKYEDRNGNNSLFEFEYLISVFLQNQTIAPLVLNKVLDDSSFCISASSSGYCIAPLYNQIVPMGHWETLLSTNKLASPSKRGFQPLFLAYL
ncbi:hypothetical protein AVEN_76786-1 [Araneus ventricosus]|uniref:Uncharacterized protein n=1 Tax=Araneus ventricosus TaxID=182803 RepID=A0A4Y2M8R4_ARAVE|nr:hypothetical protein AVEN_76786-1 [Araneus ventricosus]